MTFRGWDRSVIQTENGAQTAIEPVIISASRSTDIPAFFPDWLMARLKAGYCSWINPFNRQVQYISFAKTKVIVFWSKNPAPLMPYLTELDKRGINYYFHYTLNDYEQDGWEPNLPSLEDRINTFKKLSATIGKEKVLWRFDPLILGSGLPPRRLLDRISAVGEIIHSYTEKLLISFVDIDAYAKVRRIVRNRSLDCREPQAEEVAIIAAGLQKFNDAWKLDIATCAENYDLRAFGVAKNSCIDGALITRLCADDQELLNFLASYEGYIDKGQRSECRCFVSKDIGQYATCRHGCVYCYAGTPKTTK